MSSPVKRLLAIVALAVLFQVSAAATSLSLDNFTESIPYTSGQFIDVSTDDWFSSNVENAYKLGLMKGSSENSFNAKGNITIAETITIAARIHSIYNTGEDSFSQSTPWFQVYTEYALENGIISEAYADYGQVATRSEFATILAKSLPSSALEVINEIEEGSIPDVPSSATYHDTVYALYRAGILTGNNSLGSFTPDMPIERSAVAAIVTRMVNTELRQSLTLKVQTYFPLEIVAVNMDKDFIGTERLNVQVKNNGASAIDAFEFYSLCYDAYGDPLYYYGSGNNSFTGTWSVAVAEALPPSKTLMGTYWTYYGFTGLKSVKIALTKVHTVDGNTYELEEEDYAWLEYSW